MAKLTFHKDRAMTLVQRAREAYLKRTHLYGRVHVDDASAPQHMHRPLGLTLDSREYHLFLFFATLLTYRSQSERWFGQAVRMHELYPALFSEAVLKHTVEDIHEALVEVGYMHHEQGSGYWHQTAHTLFSDELEGDPLKLFAFRTVDDYLVYKRKLSRNKKGEQLPGIGPKIYSLMALFFEEIGALDRMPKGVFPVDIHVMRICIGAGALEGEGVVEAARVAELVRKELSSICEKNGISVQDLAHAFWFLGNRACFRCSRIKGIDRVCPLVSLCGGSPNTREYSKRGKWDFSAPRNRKGKQHPQQTFDEFETLGYFLDLQKIY